MKIVLTTLSFGKNYTKEYTCRMVEDVLKMSNIDFYITTDCKDIILDKFGENERIKFYEIKREDVKIRIPIGPSKLSDDFNFNMRYLSLVPVVDLEDAVVIFTDCDNSFDWWDEKKVIDFTSQKLQEGYDFFGPRTDYRWGGFMDDYNTKNNKEHGIFWHKIYNYDLDKNPRPEWNDAALPAECLLIFVNKNKKLKKMVEQWKWFHDYLIGREYSYGTWAEGFEIGVSALVAGFKPLDIGWHHEIWGKVFTANGYKTGPRAGNYYPTERGDNTTVTEHLITKIEEQIEIKDTPKSYDFTKEFLTKIENLEKNFQEEKNNLLKQFKKFTEVSNKNNVDLGTNSKKFKFEIGYQNPFNQWSVFHVFKKLHDKLKEKLTNVEFVYVDHGSKYNGEPGGIYSPHLMRIKNLENGKYFIISYWDHVKDLTYAAHGWDNELCAGIISSSGGNEEIKYIPSSYVCYDSIFDELHKTSKHMSEKQNNEILFRGYLYGDRFNLKNHGILKITDEKKFPIESYFEELTNNRINLSLNGAAEICNRDMEILGARSVLFRPYLKQKFHNNLIPDFHYIGFDYNENPAIQTEIIVKRFNEIKDNIELLTFISENGYNWFKENGTTDANVKILDNILTLDKINELL